MGRQLIAPSLLAANFLQLEEEVQMVNQSEADWLHLDVMDGRFVPNISFGLPVISQVNEISTKPLDVHLMIIEPEKYFGAFQEAGARSIAFHLETTNHPHRAVQYLKESKIFAGIAINPHTRVQELDYLIEDLDYVCLMSVNPGFGGQKFIYDSLRKIEKLKELIISRNSRCLIQVDGGVGLQNAESILSVGADVLVAGSAIFRAQNPSEVIRSLKDLNTRVITI